MDADTKPQTDERQAEIAHLNAKLSTLVAEVSRLRAELSKSDPEPGDIDRMLRAQVAKTIAETDRIIGMNQWYPFLAGCGIALALLVLGAFVSTQF